MQVFDPRHRLCTNAIAHLAAGFAHSIGQCLETLDAAGIAPFRCVFTIPRTSGIWPLSSPASTLPATTSPAQITAAVTGSRFFSYRLVLKLGWPQQHPPLQLPLALRLPVFDTQSLRNCCGAGGGLGSVPAAPAAPADRARTRSRMLPDKSPAA